MSKKILVGVGVIVLVLIVIIWQVAANLDSIVAGMVEDVGSDVLKTDVSVSGMSIDLKEGKAGIAGLTIANPEGYSRANLFEMEGIEVDLDLSSLGKDVLVIEGIRIDNPKIVFEGDADGGSNMQTLMDNIDSGSSADDSGSGGEPVKMIIDRLEFSGGLVKASSEMTPGEAKELKLPAITMSGIGRSQGGVTADVVAKEISSELAGAIISAVAKAGLNKAIEEKKKGFLDKLKGKG
jgi:uncharacterized protein involved in outer membrane biogenesis